VDEREAGAALRVDVSPEWEKAYPGAAVGVLALRDVVNPPTHPDLDSGRRMLEAELRQRYAGWDRAAFKTLPSMQAYTDYYRRFDKTYHVLLQLESVVIKGRPIAGPTAAVTAMFMAEIQNLLLTAGHDLDAVREPIGLGISDGRERYVRINGDEQELKEGDMRITDRDGVLSSIVYGPDRRTRITASTRSVLYTVYAPPGIGEAEVGAHLEDLERFVHLFAPQARTVAAQVVRGG
jgi:DNA/RNA-binding domain of Phe-tRNA-synthetase-like protein